LLWIFATYAEVEHYKEAKGQPEFGTQLRWLTTFRGTASSSSCNVPSPWYAS